MNDTERLARLVEREAAAEPSNLLLAAGQLLLRIAEPAGLDEGSRGRAIALIVALCSRMEEDERGPLLHDVAPLTAGAVALSVGRAATDSARASSTRPPAFTARLWMRAAGAIARGGSDSRLAITEGLAAAEPTCRTGKWLGDRAALGPALADEALSLARPGWSLLPLAALGAWLLAEDPAGAQERARPLHAVLLPHRDTAADTYVAVIPWLDLPDVRDLLAAGPVDSIPLFDALARRLAELGQPAQALDLLERHPRVGDRRAVKKSLRRLLPILPEAAARAQIAAHASPKDPFWHLQPEVLALASDAEIERHIAEQRARGFGALSVLAHDLPPRLRAPVLEELISSPAAAEHPEALFRLALLAPELAPDPRERLITRCVDVLESKTGGWLSSYDGCDVAALVVALSTDARIALLAALERALQTG